jgi:hypothetical protein
MLCPKCRINIPDVYDDNYNIDHTKIKCDECNTWYYVVDIENNDPLVKYIDIVSYGKEAKIEK